MTVLTCPSCGSGVATDALYCSRCGTPIQREPAGPSLQVGADQLTQTVEERRVVTVLFADLTGSTALAERLDPEEMRLVLQGLFDTLAREVLKLDGTVDKYVGDEIMAVFGAPVAHEDDAARAVTAAAEMQRAMAELDAPLERQHGTRLLLRIGINTGEVVAGILAGPVQAAYTVVGDAVNIAKRLQAAARPGEIVVGETTRQATARSFEFLALGPIAAKGKTTSVQGYRYVGPVGEPSGTSPAQPTLVGRVPERAALLATVQSARRGNGTIVAIIGDPGIGKTRLLAEARAAARSAGMAWLQGQASSYGPTLSYLPFREMLRSFAGIEALDDDDVKWAKLAQRVAEILPDQASEIVPYVGAVLALRLPEGSSEPAASLDGDAIRRQVLRSTYLLFEGLTRARPTAIVLEDWHWADRSSEQLLEHLLPLADRLLFILTGRPEQDSPVERVRRLAGDAAGSRYLELVLPPLTPDEGAALICNILATTELPPALRDAVVRRSEGNPFFAEEILRAFRDLHVVTHNESTGWLLAEQRDLGALPTTVQGMIAARVDRLSHEAREVARLAAVIGRTFSYSMLVAVAGGVRDLDRGLDELERQALIRARRIDEREYIFTHALVQETVYAGTLVRRRREVHARVAAATEFLRGAETDELFGVLAYHYAQAEDWPKAQEYLFKVGDQALRIAADAEAVNHYERALEAYARAFGERWDPFERATVERKIGEARYRLGEFDPATKHLDQALRLLGFARPQTRLGVRLSIARELLRQVGHRLAPGVDIRAAPRPEVSEAVLQTFWFHQFIDYSSDLELLLYDILRTLNIAERAGPSHRTLRAYFGMTLMCHNIGLSGMGTRYARMASTMAEGIGGTLAQALAQASLGLDEYALGRWDAAAKELRLASSGYKAAGELEAWAGVTSYLNVVLIAQGRLGEASSIPDDLERTGRAARDRRIEALGPHCRAHLYSWAGRDREAAAEYERAMASYRSIPDHHLWLIAAGDRAKMLLRSDTLEPARALVEDGTRLARDHHLRGWWLTPLLTARAELLLRDSVADPGAKDALLAAAAKVCGQLRAQGRLHAEAVPAALREEGSLDWQRGRHDRARASWQRSLDAAAHLGAITETFETHDAIARYSASDVDRAAARSIAARLQSALSPALSA